MQASACYSIDRPLSVLLFAPIIDHSLWLRDVVFTPVTFPPLLSHACSSSFSVSLGLPTSFIPLQPYTPPPPRPPLFSLDLVVKSQTRAKRWGEQILGQRSGQKGDLLLRHIKRCVSFKIHPIWPKQLIIWFLFKLETLTGEKGI